MACAQVPQQGGTFAVCRDGCAGPGAARGAVAGSHRVSSSRWGACSLPAASWRRGGVWKVTDTRMAGSAMAMLTVTGLGPASAPAGESGGAQLASASAMCRSTAGVDGWVVTAGSLPGVFAVLPGLGVPPNLGTHILP